MPPGFAGNTLKVHENKMIARATRLKLNRISRFACVENLDGNDLGQALYYTMQMFLLV
ncbi:MAG TPA: hypothetical protein VFQ86_04755 [Arachidicoccus soli]|nr:hypothetical protein [Arachidicoccus soli]